MLEIKELLDSTRILLHNNLEKIFNIIDIYFHKVSHFLFVFEIIFYKYNSVKMKFPGGVNPLKFWRSILAILTPFVLRGLVKTIA